MFIRVNLKYEAVTQKYVIMNQLWSIILTEREKEINIYSADFPRW